MKNQNKGFIVPVLLGVIALLVIGGGIYIYKNNKADAPIVPVTMDTVIPTTNKTQQVETQSTSSSNFPKKQDIIYTNSNYGFTLQLPSSWIGYKVKSTKEADSETIFFSLGANENIFSIGVFTKLQWSKILKDDYPAPTYITEGSSYVFTYSSRQNGSIQPAPSLLKDVSSIISTFKFTK